MKELGTRQELTHKEVKGYWTPRDNNATKARTPLPPEKIPKRKKNIGDING